LVQKIDRSHREECPQSAGVGAFPPFAHHPSFTRLTQQDALALLEASFQRGHGR
jgi:hypothetical protein